MASELAGLGAINQGSSAKQKAAVGGLAENFNNFLTILTTQLQNQDPLSPMDTHEFTNQLVMFADVEQSVRQSGQFEELIDLTKSNEAIGAVSYMDKMVSADHNEFVHKGSGAALSYTLPQEAEAAVIEIYNQDGELVDLLKTATESGKHDVFWDGVHPDSGQAFPPGLYSFQVSAVNANDQPIQSKYTTYGIVDGVEYGPDGAVIRMDGQIEVPIGKVLSVEAVPNNETETPPDETGGDTATDEPADGENAA